MAGETETCEVDGWRKDDDKKDRQRRWESNGDLGELVRCRHSLSSSPGNFAVTSCHHLVTLCPQHPVTSPLSNRACQSVVMWSGSPLTLCFFNTRYREKSWGTRGRTVVSGHACLPRSQADTNATGAVDLWQSVILCAVQNPHPTTPWPLLTELIDWTQMLSLLKFEFLSMPVWMLEAVLVIYRDNIWVIFYKTNTDNIL